MQATHDHTNNDHLNDDLVRAKLRDEKAAKQREADKQRGLLKLQALLKNPGAKASPKKWARIIRLLGYDPRNKDPRLVARVEEDGGSHKTFAPDGQGGFRRIA